MSLKKMTRIDKISQLLIAKTGVSIRELAVEPVSYTHLDVYKRQYPL